MFSLMSAIGALAAICTSLSYIPQVQKALPRGSTGDLSFKMLAVLTAGLGLWVGYGIVKGDWILVLANVVGGTLAGTVLVCKLRDMRAA
ncbi:MAG: MtN3 and saliva related transrane protein [Tardiphaga sp.]|jgi:MtN3 and saliva related transmembrane protein|nr:MtN3 and saliva related transrane protein [Tardiphaga sp.]